MSGICGIVPLEGAAVDRERLHAMTAALGSRGPDRQESRVVAGAGLGHAWLRTDPDAAQDRQPLTLDGNAWIVADARIDARPALRAALAARGRDVARDCADAGLVLHAWHAWGEDCVRHLLGDFAFAIWDGVRRRLYCARDHFGVKPLFHAHAGGGLLFANTLECLREHRGVPSDLDESVIADFLLFEQGQDSAATAFAAIRRLPAASWLVAGAGPLRVGSYWDLPADPPVRPRASAECVEEFGELLRTAVSDRLRTRRVSVHMSGGLDSTAVAALAKRELATRGPHEVRAHSIVYDRLFADQERRYATLAASHLGLPLQCLAGDDYALYAGDAYAARFPEPFHAPEMDALFHDSLRACARGSRVLLTGFDGDTLLEESPRPYVARLWRDRRLLRLMAVLATHARSERRLLPRAWRSRPSAQAPAFPPWIDADFERRLGLRERWSRAARTPPGAGSARPRALRDLDGLRRSPWFFERYDAGVTRLALECRHPFLDLRVVDFCLGLAPVPWCVGKRLLRRSMRGVLPEELLRRPKTPLAGRPGEILLARARAGWAPEGPLVSAAVRRYVDPDRVREHARDADPQVAWRALRACTLERWMAHALHQTSERRTSHETAR